jgi:cytochrome c oxidase subunit III
MSITNVLSRNKAMAVGSNDNTYKMNPIRFNMWIFMVTVVMGFAGLTSAYIVRRADGNWWTFPLPEAFFYTTILIIISSITIHWAYKSAQNDNIGQAKAGLWLTLLLGLGFGIGQYFGWTWLVDNGIYLAGNPNPAGSFLYVLSGLHLLHIGAGLIFIIATLWSAYRFNVHKKSMLKIELCSTFWHFLGALWIYLYIFLMIFR